MKRDIILTLVLCCELIFSMQIAADDNYKFEGILNDGQEWVIANRDFPFYSPSGAPRKLVRVEGDTIVGKYEGKSISITDGISYERLPVCEAFEGLFYKYELIIMGPKVLYGFSDWGEDWEPEPDPDDDSTIVWDPVIHMMVDTSIIEPRLEPLDYSYFIEEPFDYIWINENKLSRQLDPIWNTPHVMSIEGVGPALVANLSDYPRPVSPYIISEAHKPGYENPITETDFLRGLPLERYADDGKKNVFEWPTMLRTDRVWVYGAYNEADNSYYESYCRFGDWVRDGYCMYRPFYEYKRMYWPDADDKDNFRTDEGDNIPVALIREEAGRVHFPNDYNESKEIIYDFNEPSQYYHYSAFEMPMVNGETFNRTPYSGEWKEQTITEVEIDGAIRRKVVMQSDAGYEIESIEGIGIINRGFLPFIYGEVPEGTVVPYLARYCDGIETVIEEFKERPWEGSAVRSIADSDTKLNIFFDLHGRQVKNPQPGSIYIRNGKKTVF